MDRVSISRLKKKFELYFLHLNLLALLQAAVPFRHVSNPVYVLFRI